MSLKHDDMSGQTRAVLEDDDDGALRPLNCFIIEVSQKPITDCNMLLDESKA
jgi:hypothetical protein